MNRIEWPILSHSDPIQFSQVLIIGIPIYVYGEIGENGPFMIILHPTNNLITRI